MYKYVKAYATRVRDGFYKYKCFNIVKTGTRAYPWNIYKDTGRGYGDNVGYGRTLADCKSDIDAGLFDDSDFSSKSPVTCASGQIVLSGKFGDYLDRSAETAKWISIEDVFPDFYDDEE